MMSEFVVLAGHVVLFLLILHLAYLALKAYRATDDRIQLYLAVAFGLMVLGISGDDVAREILGGTRLPVEAVELVPLIAAFTIVNYALFFTEPPD